jgi:tetratricopeptide (TPR) repeat protein
MTMEKLITRTFVIGSFLFLFAGCGGSRPDGSQFQHDDAAKLFLEAMQIRETDRPRSIELLNESIEARPSHNAYYHRARLYALQGDDQMAIADIEAGLKLEPESKDLKWLEAELRKPPQNRKLDKPPTAVK